MISLTKGYEGKAVTTLLVTAAFGLTLALLAVAMLAANILEQRRNLSGLEATIARAQDQSTSATPAVSPIGKRVFTATTAAEFQSQLQSHVKDVAARHAVTLDSVQMMNNERAGSLNRLIIRLDAAIPNAALGPFLADLATSEPMVLLQTMELRPGQVQSNRLNNGGRPDNAMTAKLDLSAFAAQHQSTRAGPNQGRAP
jgi:Type II secretion system (T2SS), protein M subtype b